MINLTNQNFVISGASSGIGRACALLVGQLGGRVALIGRNEERLDSVLSDMAGSGHIKVVQDITVFDELGDVISGIADSMGLINGFVHSAGIENVMPFRSQKPDIYENIFSTNVISGFELARWIVKKRYFSAEGGSLVFIASVMAHLGQPGLSAYCASKGALTAGARALALELAPRKIRVNSLLPGMIKDTAMTDSMLNTLPAGARENIEDKFPLGFGRCEDVAAACAFLLSDSASWITGTDMVVDGGYSAA